MSAQTIVQILNELKIHYQHLNQMAKEKTDIIKKNELEVLQQLIQEESKRIRTVRKLEAGLMKSARTFLREKGIPDEEPTISKVIEGAEENDREALLRGKQELEKELYELKHQNELNQQLLEQSLQFVEMTLDLLSPDIDAYNYEPSEIIQPERGRANLSIFDSKV